MSSCKMTLIGLYNYDNSIFENLTFPAGVDKDLAINEILMECGEFEILYSDIDFLKYQITKWGEKHYFTFEKWLKALAEDFNPIHNYDRYEEYTDTHSGSGKQVDSEKRSDSDNRMRSESGENEHSNQHIDNAINTHSGEHSNDHSSSHDGTNTESETSTHSESKDGTHGESKTSDSTGASFTDTHSTTDDDVKRNVSAYDASTYQPKEQEKTDGKTNGNGSGTSMSHVNDSSSGNDSETTNAADNKTLDSTDSFNESASDDDTESSTDYESRNVNESGDASDKRNAFESGSSTGTADRQSEHTNTDVNKHEAHLYGNIGVTTSVAMLNEFTKFYKDFNLYEQIAGLFVDEFCIRIY